MDKLNFNHFYYFYVVANEGTIKGSAEKLNVSQPTISDQIKLLEEYFECKLFNRLGRRLELNAEGQMALKYAQKVFDLGNEITTKLRHNLDLPKKTLDIGVSLFMSHYFMYDTILSLFNQDEVTINFIEADRRNLLRDLEEGRLDMIFTDTKDGLSSSMGAYRIGVNKTFVVAHKKYKKYKKNFPEGLEEVPFFNYNNNSFLKYEIELFFTKNSISPKVIGDGNDIDLLQLVTEQGKAFTIVPETAKNRFRRNKDIIVLGELEELQTSVFGIIKNSYKGLGYQLLTGKL